MIMMMLAFFLQSADAGHPTMTAGGWAFFVGAWLFILVLTIFTFGKILGNHGKKE